MFRQDFENWSPLVMNFLDCLPNVGYTFEVRRNKEATRAALVYLALKVSPRSTKGQCACPPL